MPGGVRFGVLFQLVLGVWAGSIGALGVRESGICRWAVASPRARSWECLGESISARGFCPGRFRIAADSDRFVGEPDCDLGASDGADGRAGKSGLAGMGE